MYSHLKLPRYSIHHPHLSYTFQNYCIYNLIITFIIIQLLSKIYQAFPLSTVKVKVDRIGITSTAIFVFSIVVKIFTVPCRCVVFIFYLYIEGSFKNLLLAFITLIVVTPGTGEPV